MGTIQFMTSLLTFYLKGEIKHEQNFIKLKTPNTILSVIPLGSNNETIAINQIASVTTDFRLLILSFIGGLLLTLFGLALLFDGAFIGSFVFLLWGVSTILKSLQTVLVINMTSGQSYYVFFLPFEKQKAHLVEDKVNSLISDRLDDTNNHQQTDRIIEAINNK